MDIVIERNVDDARLNELGVFDWPTWSKEASKFPWHYNATEICYFLAGDVTVTPEDGESVRMGKGDLVTFPAGMACTWEIHHAVNKHYDFK